MTSKSVIDIDKPLFFQVQHLGKDYEQWVHSPSSKPSYRLFTSDFCEFFSKTYWFVVPLMWLPVVFLFCLSAHYCAVSDANSNRSEPPAVCAHVGLSAQPATLAILLPAFTLGVLIWTLLEYCLHRFLFHLIVDTPFWITFHFIMHGQHHKFPLDRFRLVFPPLPAAVFAAIFHTTFNILFPLHVARCVFAGVVFGYVSYDMIHYYVHHGTAPSIKYFASLKTDHMSHHFRDSNKGTSHPTDAVASVYVPACLPRMRVLSRLLSFFFFCFTPPHSASQIPYF